MAKPKVAIIHDYLVQHGGGENTVEAIAELFPEAPIYTSFYVQKKMRGSLRTRKIITGTRSLNGLLGIFPILAKYITFLVPVLFENFDLGEYDIIISSSSSYAKGVITKPNQLHISYIHTPPRFLYGYSVESTKRNAWYYKPFVMIIDHLLRIWDYIAAQRPDFIVCNSECVRKRINKFYRREAQIINPPVEIDYKVGGNNNLEQPYYCAWGRLSAYKNFDLIVQAFNILGLQIKIIGGGSEEKRLMQMAKPNVKFLGKILDDEKHNVIENSLGHIFPVVDEDFGIVLVEALAHGKPTLAHKSGGATEIIRDGKDGMFFDKIDLGVFMEQLREFDKAVREKRFDPTAMKKHAVKFSKQRFQNEFYEFVMQKWQEKKAEK